MKLKLVFLILLFFSNNCISYTLFETKFNEINFISENIKNDKEKKIKKLKSNDFKNILKKTLTKNDYNNIEKNLSDIFINNFIKSINIDQEKIINNNYFANIKINFDKNKLINYFRSNSIGYVEYIPRKMFVIIYEKNKIGNNFLSKNNSYYNYLENNPSNFFLMPKLDINDRFIINEVNIENKDISKIDKLLRKYSHNESIIIYSNKIENNYFYKIYYYNNSEFYLIKEMQIDNQDIENFFYNLYPEVINSWKKYNIIDNKLRDILNCNIKFFNINELKEIKKIILNISQVDKIILKEISHKNNNYDLSYFGNKEFLINSFNYYNLLINFQDTECNISLK
tara:strand:- start:2951 stop:3973 length:1023 start_codon:yes stop_codon:yes gene_type:complete